MRVKSIARAKAQNSSRGGGIRNFELQNFSLTLPVIRESKSTIAALLACGFPTRYVAYKKLHRLTPKPLRKFLYTKWEERLFETITDFDVSRMREVFAHKDKVFVCVGYFFAYHYVREVQAEILRDFRLAHPLSHANARLYAQIDKTPDSVFLHVRRGDYLLAKNAHFIVLDGAYYERALRHIKQTLPTARVFVFSNDMPWCKAHFFGFAKPRGARGARV